VRRLVLLLVFCTACVAALNAQRPANANIYYQQLRSLLPGDEVISVHAYELKRDAATFTFRDGSIAFYPEVNGKVTGAIFRGEGHLHITPPTQQERHNLSLVMGNEEFDEDFDQVVFRFTDATAAELRKAATGKGRPDPEFAKAAQGMQDFARHTLHENLDLRLLQDVTSPSPDGALIAAVNGRKNSHLYFFIDPNGVEGLAPEEVALLNYNWHENSLTFPLAFHRAVEYMARTARSDEQNGTSTILSENLDVTIEKSGFLAALATVEIRAEQDGVRVIPFDLHSTLRVNRVQSTKGEDLDWVQEKKDDDPDFGVVLSAPLKKGETSTLTIAYAGKDVVMNMGSGNYYPVARQDWFPNNSRGLGSYAKYTMTFRVPKGLQVIATGDKVSETNEGKITITTWKNDAPVPVVGFSIGDFAAQEAKINNGTTPQGQLTVDAYANNQLPDALSSASSGATVLATLSTKPMLANELSQGQVALQIYTKVFGPLPFTHVALTQQSACNYGQSWPMLVFLPICGFFDATQQHFLGVEDSKRQYWQVVTPHEVAHQWWGQTVGFGSYRDQWMSEGFADASASIYLQATRPRLDDFLQFWKAQRTLLTQKNNYGFRPIDVGPLTMGVRLVSPKTGWNIYNDLVYPKGAYILHMIRMMMWSPQEGDKRFSEMMHDFMSKYQFKPATTEDFKAIVEEYMTSRMNIDGNNKMDWFFNEYVYGTDLPTYHFEGDASEEGSATKVHYKLTQSGVPARFEGLVPIYLTLVDGRILRPGLIKVTGSSTEEQTLQLPKMPAAVKSVSINNYYDVLCLDY
jgi:hypothetical protein